VPVSVGLCQAGTARPRTRRAHRSQLTHPTMTPFRANHHHDQDRTSRLPRPKKNSYATAGAARRTLAIAGAATLAPAQGRPISTTASKPLRTGAR